MKINIKLTFATLAALTVAVLFLTPITRANAQGKRDDHGQPAKVTFTKYVLKHPSTPGLPMPGLIAEMAGEGEGDAGYIIVAGEVLKQGPRPPAGVVAVYEFTGSEHSFTALIHGFQPVAGIGQTGVIVGVVIDGWLKGHAVEGEWTVVPACYDPDDGVGNCFEVTLEIQRDSRD
jgi:hypothetical protein